MPLTSIKGLLICPLMTNGVAVLVFLGVMILLRLWFPSHPAVMVSGNKKCLRKIIRLVMLRDECEATVSDCFSVSSNYH